MDRHPRSSLESLPIGHFVAFVMIALLLGLAAALLPGV
jgi:hypothetical protein